jgi:hypothetical protein
MKAALLMKLEDGVCNEIHLLGSVSFDKATGTRMDVLAPISRAPQSNAPCLGAEAPTYKPRTVPIPT